MQTLEKNKRWSTSPGITKYSGLIIEAKELSKEGFNLSEIYDKIAPSMSLVTFRKLMNRNKIYGYRGRVKLIRRVSRKKEFAIQLAKEKGYPVKKHHCESCKKNLNEVDFLDPSHLVKENQIHKSITDYDYYSPDNYFTQCRKCHIEFEALTTRKFKNNKTRQEYLLECGLGHLVNRVEYLINGIF